MKTYLSTIGFDISQVISLIVKYGIEKGDRFIFIRPENNRDERAENALNEIQKFANQINSGIKIEVCYVSHSDYQNSVLKLLDLINSSKGDIIANMSGGPREILISFVTACLISSEKIKHSVSFSDIERTALEIKLPKITEPLDKKTYYILKDISENQPTTITDIANRNSLSESTISRVISKLFDMDTVLVEQNGKNKKITLSFTGNVLLKSNNL